MDQPYARMENALERLRRSKGIDKMRAYFLKLGINRAEKAALLVNGGGLRFASFFHLLPELEALQFYRHLNARNIAALRVCAKYTRDQRLLGALAGFPASGGEEYAALKWMFLTGAEADGLSAEYDGLMDVSASILINRYRDKSILPAMVDLIFRRNRRGLFMHDLVWILFESKDPGILRRIAGYLKSRNKKDAELACRLLHFTPPRRIGPECNNRANFAAYLSWLEENGPYLYFTGEDFQYSCEPEHCRVDLEAKYLCKRISARDRRPVEPLTESERALLEEYRHEADDEKKLLSDYSRSIYRQNRSRWNRWIGYPIERKKELARKELEGNR